MAYVIKVHVQLPDGTFAFLPAARYAEDPSGQLKQEVVKQETPRDAAIWAEHILFKRADIVPAPIKPT